MSMFDSFELADGEPSEGMDDGGPPVMEGQTTPMPEDQMLVQTPEGMVVIDVGDQGMMPSPDEIADARHELTGPEPDAAPPDAAPPAEAVTQEAPPTATPPAPTAAAPAPAEGAPAQGAEGEQPPAQPEDEAQKLEQLRQDAQEDQQTAQMLSQIADIKHQTAMGIIGNMRY